MRLSEKELRLIYSALDYYDGECVTEEEIALIDTLHNKILIELEKNNDSI